MTTPSVSDVSWIGFEFVIIPTEFAFGSVPVGKLITSHSVALPDSVQATRAPWEVTLVTETDNGFGQVGGSPQLIDASQPAAFPELSDVKTKVKQPEAEVAVKEPILIFPEKLPINGDKTVFPS